jgi:hypothetical protein
VSTRLAIVSDAGDEPDVPIGPMLDAVAGILSDLDLSARRDRAAIALVTRLAQQIDEAEQRAADVEALYRQAMLEGAMWDVGKALDRLAKRCDVVDALARLTPLLTRLLGELGGTPAGRAAISGKAAPAKPPAGRSRDFRKQLDGGAP